MTTMPANRTQMWLARGAVAMVVVLFILLKTVGIGAVKSVRQGDAIIYSGSPLGSVFFAALGILVGVGAVIFWMQATMFHRAVSVVLGAMSIYVLFNAPTGLNHRVVVAPDYFFHRVGSWYSPTETKVNFDSLAYITVAEGKPDKDRRKTYELRCLAKNSGESIRIPLYDMMKKALPEILQAAAQRNVVIDETTNDPR